MRFFPAILILAVVISGCGKDNTPAPAASPLSQFAAAREEAESKLEAEFKVNKIKARPGSEITTGPFKISEIKISRADSRVLVSMRAENISKNKVVGPSCELYEGRDEHGNEIVYKTDFSEESFAELGDQLKELQPGESGVVTMYVEPKLKAATKGILKISIGQTRDRDDKTTRGQFTLEFDIPK